MLNTDDELSEADTDAGIETDSNIGLKTGYSSEPDFDLNNIDEADLVSGVLATEADKFRISKKKKCKSIKSDAAK